jgi:antitoxin component YwqK of YwqJK toxin-antitoxin module
MGKQKLSFLILIFFLASCGTKMEEVVSESFPDGSPKRVQYYTGEGENRYLAKDVFYYQNGQKKVEGTYNRSGKKHGNWIYWYQDGKKWSEGYYNEGLDDGLRKAWHENGKKHFIGRYDRGKRIGVWKFWDENGKLAKEIDYNKEGGTQEQTK